MITDKPTTIHLNSEDAFLFREFQRHYQLIGYFVGYLESMGTDRIQNSKIELDIDNMGIINHASITKHFRK